MRKLLLLLSASLLAACASAPAHKAPRTETFVVVYTEDYGYSLSAKGNPDALLEPEFPTAAAQSQFDLFFTSGSLEQTVGKHIYCECTGVRYTVNGVEHFRVDHARLYAE